MKLNWFTRPWNLILDIYAENLLEDFFVAAIVSVLGIRLYLQLTGFPQLTIGELHIAHVVWGGLLMLTAMIILFSFLDRSARELAAVVGGAGFGAFIDELGKFITRDNDYFYEPTIALLYIGFVLLFLFIRAVARREPVSSQACYANVFEIAQQANISGLDPEERQYALGLLDGCRDESLVNDLRDILNRMPAESRRLRLVSRLKGTVHSFYESVTPRWWFVSAVVGLFTFVSITSLYTLVALIEWSWAVTLWTIGGILILAGLFWSRRKDARNMNIITSVAIVIVSILLTWAILSSLKQNPMTVIDWAQLIFPGLSGVMIVIGLLLIPVSRLRAYVMFRRAILVSIFLTQVLAFYEYQLVALAGMLLNIVILVALRYMITHEEFKAKGRGIPS